VNKDEIWKAIKNDKSTIYGEPFIDLFLKTTNQLEPRHFEELTPEQKKEISPSVASWVFWKSTDPKKGFELIGVDNFNKITNPLRFHLTNLTFGMPISSENIEELIEIIKKYHKNSDKFAFAMCTKSKNPEKIIKDFGIEKIYQTDSDDILFLPFDKTNSSLTKYILIHAFKVGKLDEVGELLKEKIYSMEKKHFIEFALGARIEPKLPINKHERGIKNLKEIEEGIKKVQEFALKYREKLTSEEIRVLSYYDKNDDFLLKVFEKQGSDK